MSKIARLGSYSVAAFFAILLIISDSAAQEVEAEITVSLSPAPIVSVKGRFLTARALGGRTLSFLREYAGTRGLAARISDVGAGDREGRPIGVQRSANGEYLAESEIITWRQVMDASPIGRSSAMAHISWITADRGILRLDDLLPQFDGDRTTAKIRLQLPDGWQAFTAEPATSADTFEIQNVEKAVFVIARAGLSRRAVTAGDRIQLNIYDDWRFDDKTAADMAETIFGHYRDIFGGPPSLRAQITFMRMPAGTPFGVWEADTRGGSIVILSSDMPFESQSRQRLHEQLRHEIFHLWIPDGVNLTGRYDWFYEGFALYASLKAGVASNQIRFDDMLSTLGRAYDADRMHQWQDPVAGTAGQRTSGTGTRVYARGMLAAFLCDIALLDRSRTKTSIADILRSVYRNHGTATSYSDGNDAILAIMQKYPELRPVIDRYILGVDAIEWSNQLATAGMTATTERGVTKLSVIPRPRGRQKDLLDRLGYNNWRKLAGK